MPTQLLHGCDVSKYQTPSLVNWGSLDFGIARATYGKWADPSAPVHLAQMRAGKAVPGLYAFFRADQDPREQATTFFQASQLAHLAVGDLVPWIDVEDFPGHQISPADMAGLEAFADTLDSLFACQVGIYITQRDWHRLGKPSWILERPLWVAHYPAKGSTKPLAKPATPNGVPWRIWQWLVGPLGQALQDPTHKRAVDQDVAVAPLPLIPAIEPESMPFESTPTIPWLGLQDADWQDMIAARDHTLSEEDEKNT
jgi:GH25 family lysozyme M1 (1,4-beta-N-acetylmuramidase)